jgi:hypothetical protein
LHQSGAEHAAGQPQTTGGTPQRLPRQGWQIREIPSEQTLMKQFGSATIRANW